MLKKLVGNSRAAIDSGTYDVSYRLESPGRDLLGIIRDSRHAALITEIKFASPSMGRIRTESDPAGIAGRMVRGGAAALSVLTQPHLFGGSPEYFARVRGAVDVPMLMKDIIIDRAQIDAAQNLGADYILLIQSLSGAGYADTDGLADYAHRLGLGVLLEVHTKKEFDHALSSGADLVGINNRNLDTLEVDLSVTGDILSGYDGARPIVSESGIRTARDVLRLREYGAAAFLVGSHIMQTDNITGAVRDLVEAY